MTWKTEDKIMQIICSAKGT